LCCNGKIPGSDCAGESLILKIKNCDVSKSQHKQKKKPMEKSQMISEDQKQTMKNQVKILRTQPGHGLLQSGNNRLFIYESVNSREEMLNGDRQNLKK
jgi:hypothetical protein